MKALYNVRTKFDNGEDFSRDYNSYRVIADDIFEAIEKVKPLCHQAEIVDSVEFMSEIEVE